jgi:hypothetical protein
MSALQPIKVNLSPDMVERLNNLKGETGISKSELIRSALALAYGPQPRAPEPYPAGSNLKSAPRGRGFMF